MTRGYDETCAPCNEENAQTEKYALYIEIFT